MEAMKSTLNHCWDWEVQVFSVHGNPLKQQNGIKGYVFPLSLSKGEDCQWEDFQTILVQKLSHAKKFGFLEQDLSFKRSLRPQIHRLVLQPAVPGVWGTNDVESFE